MAIAYAFFVAGCVMSGSAVKERESYWRGILAEQAPMGAPKRNVIAVYEQHQLNPREGTYRTVRADGTETSNCRLPEKALSAYDRGAVRGFLVSWDIEITACFDERDAVEGHFVGAWNTGF